MDHELPLKKVFEARDRDKTTSVISQYLAARPEILFAYLFGSVLESDSFHDIDVAVYVRDARGIGDSLDYTLKMSLELERMLGFPVDIVLMNSAPDHLIHSISKGRVLVNRDDDVRVDFITSSWSRYFDVQGKRRQAIADMLS